jgi:hypothetical protein
MPKLFPLLLCCLLSFASSSQAPPAFPDTPTITETSVGKAQIGMPTSKLKKLYKGCTFEQESMRAYGLWDSGKSPSGLCVKFKGHPLFIANIFEEEVGDLVVLNNKYKTAKGMHVGSTAARLKAALPMIRVQRDNDRRDLQTADPFGVIVYYFKNAQDLGDYKQVDTFPLYYTKDVPLQSSAAEINWILVRDTRRDI